ncbi:cytochrome C oxidase subunit IV family protein [Mycobacterium sp. pR1184]|uniref:cytochrome C oxidase subunit IV family protein n=1 Tax=Mycobacterium sp. pR1184 TaxID=3238981 RepID=UPI00351B4A2E
MSFALLRARSTVVWLVLVMVTMLSWALGADHGVDSTVGVVVLGLAVVKVRFVGLDFMELRNAPLMLRALFEAYCIILWVVLAGMYLWF